MNAKVYRNVMMMSVAILSLTMFLAMLASTNRNNISMISAYCADKPAGTQLWADVYCR